MKKVMAIFLMVIGMAALFAGTHVQTIVLMSVVEEVTPVYSLEVEHVENGYAYNTSCSEVAVKAFDIRKDVKADLSVMQALSRYTGRVKITVSASELEWNGFRTKGLRISGSLRQGSRRIGWTETSGNSLVMHLEYTGAVLDSEVAEVTVNYNGSNSLPQGDYTSHITMVIETE